MPTLHANAFFTIGDSHLVCEDYALAGVTSSVLGRTFAIVSDGCSAAHHTDFGSRLLALAALQHLQEFDGEEVVAFDSDAVIERATGMADALGLPADVLYATLLIAFEEGDDIRVIAWGDGVIASRSTDGVLRFDAIEFPDSAPNYLAYKVLPDGVERYLASTDNGARWIYTHEELLEGSQWICQNTLVTGYTPFERRFSKKDHVLVMLFSDGAQTFHRPVADVVSALTSFKTYTGDFAVRRCRRALKLHRGNGGRVEDDLSCAAIYIGR